MPYKDDKPKAVIENFVIIMENDGRYANIKYNELSNRAEIHKVEDGKPVIALWSDADEAASMNYIEKTFGLYSKITSAGTDVKPTITTITPTNSKAGTNIRVVQVMVLIPRYAITVPVTTHNNANTK